MIGNYVKIPRQIIECRNSIELRIVIFTYLAQNRGLNDMVKMSINDVVNYCGYIPNPRIGKINSKVTITLDTLEGLGYFSLLNGEYVGDKLCTLKLNTPLFDVQNSFACISLLEIDRINNYIQDQSISLFDKLLLVLAYIRVNKLRRSSNQQSNPKKKPEFFYRHINKISEDLDLNSKTVTACVAALESLDIIVSCPMPRYQDKYGQWHTDVTLFVDKINDWQQELEWGKTFLLKGKTLHEDDKQSEPTIEF